MVSFELSKEIKKKKSELRKRFLMGSQNCFSAPPLWQDEKHLSSKWFLIVKQILLVNTKEMCREQYREYAYWCWGVKGLNWKVRSNSRLWKFTNKVFSLSNWFDWYFLIINLKYWQVIPLNQTLRSWESGNWSPHEEACSTNSPC